MNSKQDLQGVRTAADIERKYSFGKKFQEILGIATDARDQVDKVSSSVTKLDQRYTEMYRDAESIRTTVSAIEEVVNKSVDTEELQNATREIRSELTQFADRVDLTFEAINKYIEDQPESTYGFIRQGFFDTETGKPIVGIAIGQDLKSTTVNIDGKDYQLLDRAQACAFYTAERVSFRINGNEVAYVSQGKLFISEAQIVQTITVGEWQQSHSDSGFVIQYIGG